MCVATSASPRTPGRLRSCEAGGGAAIAARKRAQREWEELHSAEISDPAYFRGEILPRLAGITLTEIMAAAGISKAFASQIRAPRFTPHESTWAALDDLARN